MQTISSDNATLALRHVIALFQEYYRIPGNGILNDATLEQTRKPRCGIKDISSFVWTSLRGNRRRRASLGTFTWRARAFYESPRSRSRCGRRIRR
ncbi:hypothetical protein P5V15_001137 [Pogonomyrmex californicus]